MTYYTEYPTTTFKAESDNVALIKAKHCKVLYRESNSKDGMPFIFLKEEMNIVEIEH